MSGRAFGPVAQEKGRAHHSGPSTATNAHRVSRPDPDRPVAKLDRQSPTRPLADARCGWKNPANSSRPRRPEVWCTVEQEMFPDQPALRDKEGRPYYTESVYHRYTLICSPVQLQWGVGGPTSVMGNGN